MPSSSKNSSFLRLQQQRFPIQDFEDNRFLATLSWRSRSCWRVQIWKSLCFEKTCSLVINFSMHPSKKWSLKRNKGHCLNSFSYQGVSLVVLDRAHIQWSSSLKVLSLTERIPQSGIPFLRAPTSSDF